jgi:cytochrome c553
MPRYTVRMKMKIAVAALAATLFAGCGGPETTATSTRVAAAGERPAKLGLCIACHGETDMSRIPGTPHIAGQDEAYLRRSLTQYRENRRPAGGAMNAAAGSLSNDDIRELAAWYARRPWMDVDPVTESPQGAQ